MIVCIAGAHPTLLKTVRRIGALFFEILGLSMGEDEKVGLDVFESGLTGSIRANPTLSGRVESKAGQQHKLLAEK
jgi:hypothetical protein